jgi:hypothetical protein
MKRLISLGSIAVILAIAAFPVAADVLVVGPGQTYTVIEDAIGAANPYDTILVLPGTYNDPDDDDIVIPPGKDGLTIISTEVATRGENTIVDGFSIGFPPSNGPSFVTIAGFKIVGGGDNGVCIESAGDYATLAFNQILDCGYDGIRIAGGGNFDNNVHHNILNCSAGGCFSSRNAIQLEDSGSGNHNIHQNVIIGTWNHGINVASNNNIIHQNEINGPDGRVLRVSGDYNFLHHNVGCGGVQIASSADETKLQHNDYFSLLDQSSTTVEKKNDEISTCPL